VALEEILELEQNTVEACEKLNLKLKVQTTPFRLPFDIQDLTRGSNLEESKPTHRPPVEKGMS
jgi:hypothetical protein